MYLLYFSGGVRKTDVQKWTLNQLLQTVNNWEDQSKRRKENDVTSPLFPMNRNSFPQGVCSSNFPSSNVQPSPFRQPMYEGNRANNLPSRASNTNLASANEEFNFVGQSLSNTTRSSACLSNSSTAIPINRPILASRPQILVPNNNLRQQVPNLPPSHSVSQNFDPLRRQTNNPENVCKAPIAGQSRFVPKRATFPVGASNRSESFQLPTQSSTVLISSQENAQGSTDLHSSKDLFSDADDIDISSVLDGIDSDLLFGDF